MAENQPISFADSIRDARQRLALELRAQAEQIQRLNLELTELEQIHERTELEASRQWDAITHVAELAIAAAADERVSPDAALENVLGAVRNLVTCTIPEQVLAVLTEEAAQWGVRAAIFDVRGKAAWGAAASGFGPALSEQVLRTLIVPLNQDNPFRQVAETAGHVDASADTLRKNRNLLDKFKPAPHAPILLLPVRSAGTVAAILYADPGEKGASLPVNALKILAEFAGAQIDRLIALSGGFSADEADQEVAELGEREAPGEEPRVEVAAEAPAPTMPPIEESADEEPPVEEPAPTMPSVEESADEEPPAEELAPAKPPVEEPVLVDSPVEEPVLVESSAEEPVGEALFVEESVIEETVAQVHPEVEVVEPQVSEAEPIAPEPEPPAASVEVVEEPPEPVVPMVESEPAPRVFEPHVEEFPPPPPFEPRMIGGESATPPAPVPPAAIEIPPLSEAEQKLHKDAKRFARLLVSEIELYNKAKVAEGRKNRDLYKRLKADIDRSRQTFEKRFGKSLSRPFTYFHDELVRTLAANDASALGPEYPGPSA